MRIENFYTSLHQKGVRLKASEDCQHVEYDAPHGSLTDESLNRLRDCKQEMLEYVLEVEETAALLVDNGYDERMADIQARKVVNHRWMCVRDTPLQARIRSYLSVQTVESVIFKYSGTGCEIVSVESDEKAKAA
jgi:hypothetical protein